LPPGSGTVNWEYVKKGLENYKGRMVTELSDLEEGRKSIEFLKQL
jgi:sugar phosphate isomerase/epimerase